MERILTILGKRRNQGLAAALLALLCCPALGESSATAITLEQNKFLFPEARHESIGQLVSQFIQNSHYNRVAVDDKLSSQVLDLYIERLDRNRMYLLSGDIEYFEKYRYELDDIVKSKPLDPVYEIFEVYQTRLRERLTFALRQLETAWEKNKAAYRALILTGAKGNSPELQRLKKNNDAYQRVADTLHDLIDEMRD